LHAPWISYLIRSGRYEELSGELRELDDREFVLRSFPYEIKEVVELLPEVSALRREVEGALKARAQRK
jgi:hypothetical protein